MSLVLERQDKLTLIQKTDVGKPVDVVEKETKAKVIDLQEKRG